MSTAKTGRWRLVRPRFSLRTILLLVSVLCLWLGYNSYLSQRQKHAVATIREYGGWVRYSYQFNDDQFDPQVESWLSGVVRQYLGEDLLYPVVEVNLVYSDDSGKRQDNSNVTEAPLECLVDLPKLRGLFVYEGQINDENMKYVAALKHLEKFYAWDAKSLTDRGVAYLKSNKHLNYIHISDAQITDKSLQLFSELPDLEGLSLQFNSFTDLGVRSLQELGHLKSLWVCGKQDRPNDITGASLDFLLKLNQFDTLGIQNTQVSEDFVSQLKSKFPKCTVAQ